MKDKNLLIVDKISYDYETDNGKKEVLQNVSFNISKNELVGIIGKNGSGKSTLFNCITGFNSNYQGTILLNDINRKKYTIKEMAKKISYIPQKNGELPDFMSVYDFILSGRRPYTTLGFYKIHDYIKADEAISFFNLSEFKDKPINKLSGGEFQRVQLARVYTQDTELIICDEPVSALDVKYQREFFKNIKKIQHDSEVSVLVSIHDLNLALEFCSRIILINNNSVFFDGSPDVLNEEKIHDAFDINVERVTFPINYENRSSFIYY